MCEQVKKILEGNNTVQKLAPLCVILSRVLQLSGYTALRPSLSSRPDRPHLLSLFFLIFLLLIIGHGERLHLSHLPEGL